MKSIANLLGENQEVFEFFSDYLKYFFEPPTKEHCLLINCLEIIERIFSRAFRDFSEINISGLHHNEMIALHLENTLIGHLSRDSTAIKSRETPVNKKKDEIKKSERKRLDLK